MKVALYARYSDDNQRDASIADQFRICRIHAERQGWTVVEEYSDHAVSGASLLRRGVQSLITDAQGGRFQIVLSEAMDRLSRDQEDIAGLYKRMAFAGVKIVTLAEGEVTPLHVGLKGTMNALFLKDLADKTRRGLRGRVEQGKSGGGNAYGYDVVRRLDTNGEALRGDRAINLAEAEVVRRIFRDYAAGKSPKRIATELNKEGIWAPGGGQWGYSTLNGNVSRGNGVLNNELYVGRLIWNRQRFIKDPDTGKRQGRLNPREDWIIQEVPELRIIDDALWQAVKDRQASLHKRQQDGKAVSIYFRDRRRPRYLLSGLTRCGCCGGGYGMISKDQLGCSTAHNKGTCDNRVNIRRDQLEARVLDALRHHLMDPALFATFCEEFTGAANRLRMEARADIEAAKAEIARIERELDRMVDMIAKGQAVGEAATRLADRMNELAARQSALKEDLVQAEEPPPLLHPEMAGAYRAEIEKLHEALTGGADPEQRQAQEAIRALIEAIVLTPGGDQLQIDVRGDLAGILAISNRQKPFRQGPKGFAKSQVEMGAGTGFDPVTFRL